VSVSRLKESMPQASDEPPSMASAVMVAIPPVKGTTIS
jgi:hypothetical protein